MSKAAAIRVQLHALSARALAIALALGILLTLVPQFSLPAHAAAGPLTITNITWDVVGLDSNRAAKSKVTAFPVGVKVCNTGDTATSADVLTNYTVGTTDHARIDPPSTLQNNLGTIAANKCVQSYYTVALSTAPLVPFGATETYTVNATSTGLSTVTTPTRTLYVERLVSQNRNDVISITAKDGEGNSICSGSTCTVRRGQSYTFTLNAKSASGGYPQTEAFINFPSGLSITNAKTYYAAPVGATADGIYADACGWDPATRACVGPVKYSGGKAGGNPIRAVYTIKVSNTATVASTTGVTGMIYDLSGGSYHYNADASTDTRTIVVEDAADLQINKSHTGAFARGQNGTYSISVKNNGPSATPSTGVTVTDTLPTGLTFVSGTGTGWNACSASGQTVTCTNSAAIASGSTSTITLTVATATGAAASVTNSASVAMTGTVKDPVVGNNSVTDVTTTALATDADLVVTNTAVGTFTRGGSGSYLIKTRNDGPSLIPGTASNPITITDTLPTGLTYASFTSSGSGTDWTCSASGQLVTCTLPSNLAVNASADDITINVSVGSSTDDTVVNTVTAVATDGAAPNDPLTTNNVNVTASTNVGRADLEISKSHVGTFGIPASGGSNTGSFTLTVKNNGPDTANGPITITDTLPTGLTYNSFSGAGWNCSAASLVVTCTRSTALASGASSSLTLTANVASGQAEGALTNTASVSSSTFDSDSSNNSVEDAVAVQNLVDVGITVTDSPDPVTAGASATVVYTIVTKNNLASGGASATNVFWSMNIPAGTTFNAVDPDGAGALTAADHCSFPATGSTGEVTCFVTATSTTAGSDVGLDLHGNEVRAEHDERQWHL